MAVTVVAQRILADSTRGLLVAFVNLTLSGTYATGGFALNPLKIYGAPGSSPLPSANVLSADFYSPLGYIYRLIGLGSSAVVKIFSLPNTELGAGVVVPDATLNMTIKYKKFG